MAVQHCTSVQDLSAHLDGELSPQARVALESHLKSCPSCAARLAELSAVGEVLRRRFEAQAEARDFSGFTSAVLGRLKPYRPSLGERLSVGWEEWKRHRAGSLWGGFAVVAAVLVAVFALPQLRSPRAARRRRPAPQPPGRLHGRAVAHRAGGAEDGRRRCHHLARGPSGPPFLEFGDRRLCSRRRASGAGTAEGWPAVRAASGSTVLAALLLATPALSQSHVALAADVVQASNEGAGVDAGLEKMREQFAKSGIVYKSYRRVSHEQLQLLLQRAVEVRLPNAKTATLTLLSLKGSQSQVSVSLPPLQTTYTLGREGSVYLQAGPHANGVLILVLTPVGG